MTVCGHCGKRGHDTSRCWTLHPDQLPWKSANVVEENHHYHGDRPDSNGMSVCSFERDTGSWQAVVRKRCKATRSTTDSTSFQKWSILVGSRCSCQRR